MTIPNKPSAKFVFAIYAALVTGAVAGVAAHHYWLVTESKQDCPIITHHSAKLCPKAQ